MSGLLMPIGGAEDKRAARSILTHFVRLCGGAQAHIVVIPSASGIPHLIAPDYQAVFAALGAKRVTVVHVENRSEADNPWLSAPLANATGVFMSGGDQMRLMARIGGTRLADTLRQRHANGMHVAGTSAGASIMSQQMIAFGHSGMTPSQQMVHLAPGLGLTEKFIIDQHFSQRNRIGRLISACALHPGLTGLGIDEDTAMVIGQEGSHEVVGSGAVTVIDRRTESTADSAPSCAEAFATDALDIRVLRAAACA